MMSLGLVVAAILSAVLVLYINSFLMKQRQKELGLYNILGMGKGNIARLQCWERLYTALIGIARRHPVRHCPPLAGPPLVLVRLLLVRRPLPAGGVPRRHGHDGGAVRRPSAAGPAAEPGPGARCPTPSSSSGAARRGRAGAQHPLAAGRHRRGRRWAAATPSPSSWTTR